MNKSLLLLALAGALAGCHRKAVPVASTTGPGTSVAVKGSPAVRATNTSFQYLSAKGKAEVTTKGNQQSANLNVRLRRDSVIWISGSLLGIEGVRACLTPDSVRVVNRLQKEYFAGTYDYLSKLLNVPVSFAQVQAILLGDYLAAPGSTTPTVAADGDNQRVSYPLAGTVVERLLQGSTGRVQQLTITDAAAQRSLHVDYADFKPLEGQAGVPFAHTANVRAQQAGATTTARLEYSKVTAGGERLDFPFSIPKGYKRR